MYVMKFLPTNTLLTPQEIEETFKNIDDYTTHLKSVAETNSYKHNESSINLPFDEKNIEKILRLKKKLVSKNLKYIIDIGIGGSNLGTKAVYDALFGYFETIEPNRHPKIVFLDTNDPEYISKLTKFIAWELDSPDEILINTISKSGSTAETLANTEILLGKFPKLINRLVITTDYDSKLDKSAKKDSIQTLHIPSVVGGRFSVFSAVGLFPLAAAGVDILDLLRGAMLARKYSIHDKLEKNAAAVSAIFLYRNLLKGFSINDTFLFSPQLESLGKWYRQLMGESIGKNSTGITPTVSIGSTDLHSMGQLYLGGPKDKSFTFVKVNHNERPKTPQDSTLNVPDMIEGKTANKIMSAIYDGTTTAFKQKGIPFVEVIFEDLQEREIAQFMQFKMIEMMYLGKLLGVNTFNQPNVEEYKKITKKLLV